MRKKYANLKHNKGTQHYSSNHSDDQMPILNNSSRVAHCNKHITNNSSRIMLFSMVNFFILFIIEGIMHTMGNHRVMNNDT